MKLINPIRLKQALAVSAILEDKKTIEQIIDEQPTIEPERKKGKWINLKNKKGTILALRCSVCGNSPKHAIRSDFCPNCGADMRGEEDD